MNVLSLFDGMSCGQIALNRLGIKYKNYYASEIDKYAIQVAQANYPDTIQLGSIEFITKEMFGENKIDLIIGGSPCQGFSLAGKQLNFKDPRSLLFFEFVRLIKELKPKYFMLENVKMKKDYENIITEYMEVEPIEINSALVSAQNRKRLYWTNIPNIIQPNDKGILLKDILEEVESPPISLNKNQQNKLEKINPTTKKANCLTEAIGRGGSSSEFLTSVKKKTLALREAKAREFNKDSLCHHAADATDIKGHESIKRVYADSGKSPTLNSCSGGNREPKVLCGALRGRSFDKDGNKTNWKDGEHKQVLEVREDGKTNSLTSVTKDNLVVKNESMNSKGKAYSLTASYQGAVAWNSCERKQRTMVPVHETKESDPNIYNGVYYRKLTPVECERLQTVPDNYTDHVSKTQRYKMLGNGWTVDVICHILKNLPL